MKVKIPLYRTSCLLPIAILLLFAGFTASVVRYNPDGSKQSEAKIPYGYKYSMNDQTLRGDEVIMEAGAKLAGQVIKESPETVAKIVDIVNKQKVSNE